MNPPVEPEAPQDSTGNPPDAHGALPPEVFAAELEEIAKRNPAVARQPGARGTRPSVKLGLTGLAFSGGGIRSATFNLGALQALSRHGVLPHMDYLSTVSGGGYIGSCYSANMAEDGGASPPFPFAECQDREASAGQGGITALDHLRAHSNYLAPRGLADWLQFPMLLLRGILANGLALLPYVVMAAILTVLLAGNAIRCPLEAELPANCELLGNPLPFSRYAAYFLLCWLLLYPLLRRLVPSTERIPWRVVDVFGRINGILLLSGLVVLVVEVQPLAVYYFLKPPLELLAGIGTTIMAGAALLGGRMMRRLGAIVGRLGVYLVGLLGPLAFYLIYLLLCRWAVAEFPSWIFRLRYDGHGIVKSAFAWTTPAMLAAGERLGASGVWFQDLGSGVLLIYVAAGLGMFLYAWLVVDVNQTSLHGFYRHRLSRAYIFSVPGGVQRAQHRDALPMSGLSGRNGPYHLINAALNLGGAPEAATRGMPVTTFFFGKRYAGSGPTGYWRMEDLERADRNVDLATCMAISGAAAAPVMGRVTERPLVFLLAILNIRLGYWLPNPAVVRRAPPAWLRALAATHRVGPIYLLRELFGLVGGDSANVFVSDGGHVENLAIHELLRRRCRVIIACDAEADAAMKFEGLATALRLAWLELCTRIEIDLDALRERGDGLSRRHCAVGRITYPDGEHGVLVYIKSSVTGDEGPVVEEYRQRSLAAKEPEPFPHQTTADQMFDEAQFEAYRLLGEHIVDQLFAGRDAPLEDAQRQVRSAADWRGWLATSDAPQA